MHNSVSSLKKYDSPTICDALERMGIRPLNEGFLPGFRMCSQKGEPYIGYASTAKYATAAHGGKKVSNEGYYRHILQTSRPGISVIEDVDLVPHGAVWGEVMAHSHACMGSVALVTNGFVRDIDALDAIGFGYFAGGSAPSRSYICLREYACPVQIGGVMIHPGDLLFCDRYGLVVIPPASLGGLEEACEKTIHAEDNILAYCKELLSMQKEADPDILMQHSTELARLRKA